MSSPERVFVPIPVMSDTPGEALPTPGAGLFGSGALADAVILQIAPFLLPASIAGPAGPGPGDDDDDDDEESGGGSGGNIDPDDDEGYDDEDDEDDDEEPLRCAPTPR